MRISAQADGGRRDPSGARTLGLPELWRFRSVGSTNDVAKELADRGAPSGTAVIADEQSAGRGRGGRRWASPSGLGAWLSVVLRADDAATPPLVPLVAGMAAARALDAWLPPPGAGVKWPNDLLVGGRKIGGILCESAWGEAGLAYVVAGVGVNVLQGEDDFPADLRGAATSIRLVSGGVAAPASVAGAIAAALAAAGESLPSVLDGEAAAELAARDLLAGREVVVSAADGREGRVSGIALGIAPDGALLLRTTSGVLRRVRSGTVRTTGGHPSLSTTV